VDLLLVSVLFLFLDDGGGMVRNFTFLFFFGLCAYVHCHTWTEGGEGDEVGEGEGLIVVKCKLERDMHFDSFEIHKKLMMVLSKKFDLSGLCRSVGR